VRTGDFRALSWGARRTLRPLAGLVGITRKRARSRHRPRIPLRFIRATTTKRYLCALCVDCYMFFAPLRLSAISFSAPGLPLLEISFPCNFCGLRSPPGVRMVYNRTPFGPGARLWSSFEERPSCRCAVTAASSSAAMARCRWATPS